MKLEAAIKTESMKTFWDLAKTETKGQDSLVAALHADAGSLRLEAVLNSAGSKASSVKLGELTGSKAPADTVREGDALQQQQDVEKAKLKTSQLGESKALYGKQQEQKKTFEKHQSEVKEKFMAKKPSQEQIATFNKVQAADKKSFEAGLVKENVALYNKHQAQNKDQAKWHSLQKQDLDSKYASKTPAKPLAKTAISKPVAKPTKTIAAMAGVNFRIAA